MRDFVGLDRQRRDVGGEVNLADYNGRLFRTRAGAFATKLVGSITVEPGQTQPHDRRWADV